MTEEEIRRRFAILLKLCYDPSFDVLAERLLACGVDPHMTDADAAARIIEALDTTDTIGD